MKQKRILLLIFSVIALFVVISLIILLLGRNSNPPTKTTVSPTSAFSQPTLPQQTTSPLQITSVSPSDKATDVGLDQKITITFNQPVTLQNLLFSLSPSTSYDLSIAGNNLIITSRDLLTANTTYTYSVTITGKVPQSFSFTTTPVSITSQDSVPGASDQLNKEKFPDIFVYNRVPFSSNGFSVTGGFTSTPSEHYYFTVMLTSSDGKTAFLNWLKSLGLTDQQIQSLDIRY